MRHVGKVNTFEEVQLFKDYQTATRELIVRYL